MRGARSFSVRHWPLPEHSNVEPPQDTAHRPTASRSDQQTATIELQNESRTYSARTQCRCTVEDTCRAHCCGRTSPHCCTLSSLDARHSRRTGSRTMRPPKDTYGQRSRLPATRSRTCTSSSALLSRCRVRCTTALPDTTLGYAMWTHSRHGSRTRSRARLSRCCSCTRGSTRRRRASGPRTDHVRSTQRFLSCRPQIQRLGCRGHRRTQR